MPVVNVSTAKYCTVPKSASVSINASDSPAAIAGRAIGRATVKKLPQAVRPSTRLASSRQTDCETKAARVRR
jgi:hypothetical protein